MQLRARAASLTAVALVLSAAAAAVADPPIFDFNGYAQVPANIGGTLTMRSVLTNNGVIPTPVPLNFALNQYTLVLTGTLASAAGIAQQYNPASISLYEDAIGGGTAADYAVPGTFTDGTLILAGSFNGNLTRNTFSASLGSFVGKVDFSSGSMLGLLPTANGWPFGGGISRVISGIPSGYGENWDGKIDLAPVGVEQKTWRGVKQLYR